MGNREENDQKGKGAYLHDVFGNCIRVWGGGVVDKAYLRCRNWREACRDRFLFSLRLSSSDDSDHCA